MKAQLLSTILLLFPILALAKTYTIREVRIHYEPVLTVSYVPTGDDAIASLQPEFVFTFIPEDECDSECIGCVEVTLYLQGKIDLLKASYPRRAQHALQIFEEQAMDASILLRHKYGGQLSRIAGSKFSDPDAFLAKMLDAWNPYWEKSREIWEPYLAALRTGNFPRFEKNYVRSFRYHHFGEAVPVSG